MDTDTISEEPTQESHGFALKAAVLLLAAAASAFRLWGLLRNPLWLDEAYSAYAVEKGFSFIWTVVPTYDTHPPLYYTILRIWSLLAGDSLAGLRVLGVMFGLATIVAAALIGREIARALHYDERLVSGAAALLVTFSPLMIDMSQEVRPYPVMILSYAIAIAAMLRVARVAAESGSVARPPLLLYLGALEATMWLHNVGPLFGASLTLAFVVLVAGRVRERSAVRLLVAGHLLVAILYVPALLMLLDQAPTWVKTTWLVFQWTGLHWKLAALWGGTGIAAVVAAAALVAMGVRRMLDAGGSRVLTALAVTAALPPALSIVVSATVAPIFLIRTLTPVSIPALVLIAVAAGSQRGRWRWVALTATLVLVCQMVVFDVNALRAAPKEDWYGATRWLQERIRPGDVVYAYPNDGLLPLDRACRDLGISFPSRPIPTPLPTTGIGWHPTGNRGPVSLPREMLREIASDPTSRTVGTVWLLRLRPSSYDKGDIFLEELARARVIVDRWNAGAIDIAGLRQAQSKP